MLYITPTLSGVLGAFSITVFMLFLILIIWGIIVLGLYEYYKENFHRKAKIISTVATIILSGLVAIPLIVVFIIDISRSILAFFTLF